MVEREKESISSILPGTLLGGALLGRHVYPRQVVNQLRLLDAC